MKGLSINLARPKSQMYYCCNLDDVLTKFVGYGCLGTAGCYLYERLDEMDFDYYQIQATVCFASDYLFNARESRS